MVPRGTVLPALVVTLLAGLGASAQRPAQLPPQTTPPVFRGGISYVELDASVLDRNRNPVRGLTASDFTVLENGQPQSILSFSEINVPDPQPPPVAWMRDVTPDVRANDDALDRRLVVILLDDGQIRVDRRQWDRTPAVAKMLIDRLGPADLAAVLFTRIQRDSQDFTSDHAKLNAAIDAFLPGAERVDAPSNWFGFGAQDTGGGAMGRYFERNSFVQLDNIAQYLAALPGRRKALFYVSVGVGMPDPKQEPWEFDTLLEIFRKSRLANLNIYPIDPSGLGGVDDIGVAGSSAPGTGSNRGIDSRQEFLRTVAENTGGYAITNRNDFDTSVPKILAENGSYYLVGYESPDLQTDGKFRKIEVKVNRPGVTVRARSRYTGAKADTPPKTSTKPSPQPSALDTAAGALIPSAEVRMAVSAAAFAVAGKPAATVIAIGVRPAIPEDLTTGDEVDLFAGAFRVDGTMAASTRQHFQIGAGWLRYDLLARLDLKPGRYQVRVSAESQRQRAAGSVFTDVDVPDFSAVPLALSGVVVHTEPGLSRLPADVPWGLVPIAPTTVRTFTPRQQVTAFLRVYQGGKAKLAAVPLSAQIRDVHDAIVLDALQTLGVDQFGAQRAADYRLTLPVDRLAPGPYLLTIDASAGTRTARRDVRFEVR